MKKNDKKRNRKEKIHHENHEKLEENEEKGDIKRKWWLDNI